MSFVYDVWIPYQINNVSQSFSLSSYIVPTRPWYVLSESLLANWDDNWGSYRKQHDSQDNTDSYIGIIYVQQ